MADLERQPLISPSISNDDDYTPSGSGIGKRDKLVHALESRRAHWIIISLVMRAT